MFNGPLIEQLFVVQIADNCGTYAQNYMCIKE